MIISQKDAAQRLSSNRNLFRPPVDSRVDPARAPEVLPVGNEPVPQDEIDEDTDYTHESPASNTPLMDTSKLDALINFSPRGYKYRGNLESQKAIAETALILGPRAAGAVFDLSTEQTRAYEGGRSSLREITEEKPRKPELVKHIDAAKARIATAAAACLEGTLAEITPARIAGIKKVTNLTKVGKDLVTILAKCTEVETGEKEGVHFHIFKPEVNIEQNYNTVVIGSAD